MKFLTLNTHSWMEKEAEEKLANESPRTLGDVEEEKKRIHLHNTHKKNERIERSTTTTTMVVEEERKIYRSIAHKKNKTREKKKKKLSEINEKKECTTIT